MKRVPPPYLALPLDLARIPGRFLSWSAKGVWAFLRRQESESGAATPTVRELVEGTGLTRNSVRPALDRLEQVGLVVTEGATDGRGGKNRGGRGHTGRYWTRLPSDAEVDFSALPISDQKGSETDPFPDPKGSESDPLPDRERSETDPFLPNCVTKATSNKGKGEGEENPAACLAALVRTKQTRPQVLKEILGVVAEDLLLHRYGPEDLERCLALLPALDAHAYRLRELVPAILAEDDVRRFRRRIEEILQCRRILATERRPDGRQAVVVGSDSDSDGFMFCLRERRLCDGRERLGSVIILRTLTELDRWTFAVKQPDLPLSGSVGETGEKIPNARSECVNGGAASCA